MPGITELLKPSYIKNEFDHFQVNKELASVIMAVGYPRKIREGWLDSLISSQGNFDISMHIKPSNIEGIITQLNQELVKQESDLLAAQMKGIVNPSLRLQHQDTMGVLERLQKGEEKLYNLSLYICARAGTKEGLEMLTRKVCSELNSIMVIPKIPFLRMSEGLKSVYPIQEDRLSISRNMPGDALSACFPFTTAFLNIDMDGILFGVNANNNIPIIIDPFRLPNYNGLILGTSGGGKSVAAKLFILRSRMCGVKTFIIDPQGEYTSLAKESGGMVVEIGRGSSFSINPFDLLGLPLGEKLISLLEFFSILFGGLESAKRSCLDKILQKVYSQKGFSQSNPATWKKNPPRMQDLYAQVMREKKGAGKEEKQALEYLESALRICTNGAFSFLNTQTNLDTTSSLISFNISRLPEQVKPAVMFLIMDFVHRKMYEDRERKALVIDEAWSLLKYAEQSQHIFELIKTARKFALSIVVITQEAEDLLSSPAGKTILANTAWKFLSRQEPAVIEELSKKFHLNAGEQNYLLSAMPGEGLLFALNDRIPLKVICSDSEYALITTKPEEVSKE